MLNEGERTEVKVKNVRRWNKKTASDERLFEVYDEDDNCYLYYASNQTKLSEFTAEEVNSAEEAVFSCTVEYVKDFGDTYNSEYYDYVVSNPRLKIVV